jgi:hypothetical protein
MATVRMSQRLKQNMLENAIEQWRKVNPKKKPSSSLATTFFQNKIEPTLTKLEQSISSLDITSRFMSRKSLFETKQINSIRFTMDEKPSMKVDLVTPIKAPDMLIHSYSSFIDVAVLPEDMNDPCIKDILNVLNYNKSLEEKLDEYRANLKHVFVQFPTLNQALRIMPELSEFVNDSEVMEKVHKKVDRKQQIKELQEVSKEKGDQIRQTILSSSLLGD